MPNGFVSRGGFDDTKDLHIVGFRIGNEDPTESPSRWCMKLCACRKSRRFRRLTEFVEGVINLRGKIISVVDLRKPFRRSRDQTA